ncbi:hypothetical protein GYB29_07570 [bacterium]|nr:hypothetical protein [bacterium]
MNKTIVFFLLILFNRAYACDVCGCGAMGQGMGYQPNSELHFIGLGWNFQSYDFEHPSIPNEPIKTGNDQFQTVSINLRYNVNPRLKLYAFVPYQIVNRLESGRNYSYSGLGDIETIIMYNLLVPNSESESAKIGLQLGGGLKLPTGKYNTEIDQQLIPNLQLGSGSVDVLFHSNLTLETGSRLAINQENRYSWRTANSLDYKFGNQLDSRLNLLYKLKTGSQSFLLPALGLSFHHRSLDMSEANRNLINRYSGMQLLNLNIGLNLFINKLSMRVNWSNPLYSHIAKDYVEAKQALNIQLNYYIKTNNENIK